MGLVGGSGVNGISRGVVSMGLVLVCNIHIYLADDDIIITSSLCQRLGTVGCLFSTTTSLLISSKLGSGGMRPWNGSS